MRIATKAGWMAALCLLMLGIPALSQDTPAKQDKDNSPTRTVNLSDLQAEVMVLNVLTLLDARASQLRGIRKVAAQTMHKPEPRKMVKVSQRYYKALTELRDALAEYDSEKIEALTAKVDQLAQKETLEVDVVEPTEAARRLAPSALRLFSARQAASYIASVGDFPDPLESLRMGLDRSRKLRDQEWQQTRDDIAAEVGWLIGGLDVAAEKKIRAQTIALLNKAAALTEAQYKQQKDALEKEARTILGKTAPTDVIRNYMERVLAEVLSSHRLQAAIDLRLARIDR